MNQLTKPLYSGMLTAVLGVLLMATTAFNATAQPATQQEMAAAGTESELAQRHYRRGNTYNNIERYDDALKEYQLAVAADPAMADAYRNMANIFLSREQYDDAISMLARFIDLQNQLSTPLVASLKTIGMLLRSAERYDEAIDYDLRAIEADPRDDSQVHLMGNQYNNAGDLDKAIRVYEKAVEVMPNNAFMNRTLGRLYENEGRLDEALAQYRKASETDMDSQFYKELVQNLETRMDQLDAQRNAG